MPQKLKIPGVELVFVRDAGIADLYQFGISAGLEAVVTKALVDHLPHGCEVLVPDPKEGDCSLELRRNGELLLAKRGCHGAAGEWKRISSDAAIAWLLPGAKWAATNAKPGFGGNIRVPK